MKSTASLRLTLFTAIAVVICWSALTPRPVDDSGPVAKATLDMPDLRGQQAVEYLKRNGVYSSLQQQIAAARYEISWRERPATDGLAAGYQTFNAAQNYHAFFTPNGMRVASLENGRSRWEWGMTLLGYGYGKRLLDVGQGQVSAEGNRVEIARAVVSGQSSVVSSGNQSAIRNPQSAIVEWYVNRPEGLEQGFTIASPPGQKMKGERLSVRLATTGDMKAMAEEGGQAIRLRKPEGGDVLRYSKLFAFDALGRALQAQMIAREGEVILEVDDEGAVYPVTIDPLLVLQKELKASDAAANDSFGEVAISGNTIVVGAPSDGTPLGVASGSAYVFVRTGSTWTQQQKLTASDGGLNQLFGEAVAIDGDTIVVGARGPNGFTLNFTGLVYVFVRSGGVWTQQQRLTSSDLAPGDIFGGSVAISGDTLVAASRQADLPGAMNAGAAYVFVRSGGVWTQQQKITASDAMTGFLFGSSAAIDGDTVAIGAQNTRVGSLNGAGAVYVFVRSSGVWTQQQRLTAGDAAAGDSLGLLNASVGLSGDTIVAGAAFKGGGTDVGAAYVFVRSGGVWTQQQKLVGSNVMNGDRFGISAAIDGDYIIIGARDDDTIGGANAGSAYSFTRSGGVWTEEQHFIPADTVAGDSFGASVGVDGTDVVGGTTVVVGAFSTNDIANNSGSAYVFAEPSAPVLTCPMAVSVSNSPGQCFATVMLPVTADGTPAPVITCMPASGSMFPVGTTTVNCTAANGNAPDASCNFTVTVTDDEAPAFNCPASVTDNNDPGQCQGVVNFTVTVTDNCDGSLMPMCVPASGSTFPVGTTTVNCSAMDSAGNMSSCSFSVTVVDNEAPVITCSAPVMVNNTAGVCSGTASFTVTATDNCDPMVTPMCTPASGSTFPVGTTTVNCSAMDSAGNTSNCSFTVTVIDNESPVINCPTPIAVNNVPGMCSAPVNFAATASDNCMVASIICNPPSGTIFPVGTTTVSCMATDTSGNQSACGFTVTVVDNESPQIVCPPSQLVPAGVVNYPAPTVTDNCGAGFTCNPPSGSVFPSGITTVNCTAMDAAGNTSSCGFTVLTFDKCVQDDANPGNKIMWSSQTGHYLVCCDILQLTGVGAVVNKGNVSTLQHNAPGRRVLAEADASTKKGKGSVQSPPGTTICNVTDRNTTNNDCSCN